MFDNPIVHKELLQASHRKRTYLLRAGLPVLAVVLILPSIINVLDRYGQDWRAISQIARPVFSTCAWMGLITFSLIAFIQATASIQDEWTHKTVEVLCASPLSRARIVYGKFAAVLGKLLMAVLALLPIMGIWLHLGRLPREIMLGSAAVIVGGMLFFGAVALLQAAMFRPKGALTAGSISLILPYLGVLILLDGFVWVNHPVLEAAIPFRALHFVLRGAGPGGMPVGRFALLSFGILSGLSLLALAVSPWLFGRTFNHHIGAGSRKKKSTLRSIHRRLRGKRPPMKPRQDPFHWQEKGPPTRFLSRSLWLIYGITAVFLIVGGLTHSNGFEFLGDEEFWAFIAGEGVVALAVMSALYGAVVFAREKSARRAQGLLLTGHRPSRFLWAKIRATYAALRWPLAAVGVVCVVMFARLDSYFWRNDEAWMVVFITAQSWLFGPALGVIIGMVFSIIAKSSARAILGFFGSVIWAIATGWGLAIFSQVLRLRWYRHPIYFFVTALAGTFAMLLFVRRWRPWLLGLLLAANFWTFVAGIATCDEMYHGNEEALMTVVGSGVCWLVMLFWFLMGLRLFDRGMAGEDAKVWPIHIRF